MNTDPYNRETEIQSLYADFYEEFDALTKDERELFRYIMDNERYMFDRIDARTLKQFLHKYRIGDHP